MRSGLNPTRRNRNIGTAKQGHAPNNNMRVADPRWAWEPYWQRMGSYRVIRRACGGRELPFFVEETRNDCVHACTIADVVAVLTKIPSADYQSLGAVIFRQPKIKEQLLDGCWGRMCYWAKVGRPQDGRASGPALILEAQRPDRRFTKSKSAAPADAAEIERLVADGHAITSTRKRVEFQASLASTRATQLYRTLPHEIGHLVQYERMVPDADEAKGISWAEHDVLFERFWQLPVQEKEAFAHRYADETRASLLSSGAIPFERIESWDADGLRSCDFAWRPIQS